MGNDRSITVDGEYLSQQITSESELYQLLQPNIYIALLANHPLNRYFEQNTRANIQHVINRLDGEKIIWSGEPLKARTLSRGLE